MPECEKLQVGKEFLASHQWSAFLRKTTHDRCYCSHCYSKVEPDTYPIGGRTYVIPRGWARFGVHVDEPFARHHNVWNTWANCYHGTSIENAKSIVEHRQLLLPRDVTLDGKKLQIREGHIPGEYYFFTTPTIRYAALDCYAYTYNFQSPSTKKHYKIKVVLQCKQKPNSFVVQPETVGARQKHQEICPIVSNDEMEWKTQHRAAIMPYGLMLQINSKDTDDKNSSKPNNDTKKHQEVVCPNCSNTNIYNNGGYSQGLIAKCVYEACKKEFQQINCPHCCCSNTWKNADYHDGELITCIYANCKKKFQAVNCPHCSGCNTWKNADYREGIVVTCAYEHCKKKFQHVSCVHCSRANTWKDLNYVSGGTVTCAYDNCKKKFQKALCPSCFGSVVWKDANRIFGSITTCPYEKCRKPFQIDQQH